MIESGMADEDYCYLTTTGRMSRRPHTIEIWFALEGNSLYLLAGAGERSDWVRNAARAPEVRVRIREREFSGRVRRPSGDEDVRARRLLLAKYQPHYSGDLQEWGRMALPVTIDLETGPV